MIGFKSTTPSSLPQINITNIKTGVLNGNLNWLHLSVWGKWGPSYRKRQSLHPGGSGETLKIQDRPAWLSLSEDPSAEVPRAAVGKVQRLPSRARHHPFGKVGREQSWREVQAAVPKVCSIISLYSSGTLPKEVRISSRHSE